MSRCSRLVGLVLLACIALTAGLKSTSASAAQAPWVASTQQTIFPAVVTDGAEDISCTAILDCTTAFGLGSNLMVSALHAGTWSTPVALAQAGLNPAPTFMGFVRLSCWSAGNCLAIGTGSPVTQGPFWYAWEIDGTWSALLVAPDGGSGPHQQVPQGVSCASGGWCVVTSIKVDGTAFPVETQVFNATDRSVSSPRNTGLTFSASGLVSCWAPEACRLVALDAGSSLSTAVYENGTGPLSWSTPATADPSFVFGAAPTSLSCSSAASCALGGLLQLDPSGQDWYGFVDQFDGSTWSQTVLESFGTGQVTSVSCVDVFCAFTFTADNGRDNSVLGWISHSAISSMDTTSLFMPADGISCAAAFTCTEIGLHLPSHNYSSVNLLPVLVAPTTTVMTKAKVGAPFSFRIPGVTGGAGAYVYSIDQGSLPSGISLDPTTGVISGTPAAEGSTTIRIKVVAPGPPDQSATFEVTILATAETTTTDPGASLASTGAQSGDLALVGLAAVGLGVLLSRRRRQPAA